MNDILIENEIQRRVDFKMKEFRTSFNNRLEWAKKHDKMSFGHLFYRGKLEAWNEMKNALDKEIHMGTPFDEDFKKRVWIKKEKIVDKISDRILKKGTKEYWQLKSFINNCVEDFING